MDESNILYKRYFCVRGTTGQGESRPIAEIKEQHSLVLASMSREKLFVVSLTREKLFVIPGQCNPKWARLFGLNGLMLPCPLISESEWESLYWGAEVADLRLLNILVSFNQEQVKKIRAWDNASSGPTDVKVHTN